MVPPLAVANLILSILYLRCSQDAPCEEGVVQLPFNSLFEMPPPPVRHPAPAPPAFNSLFEMPANSGGAARRALAACFQFSI